ncbi:MAG: hypothetical protein IH936_14835 [Acidobacteria bacterium]|nr:hypothetical protein [Acidobacteriota bacterium]
MNQGSKAPLEGSGLADPAQLAHGEPEIEARDMDQASFEDIAVVPQVSAAHRARCVAMGEAALNLLPAKPLKVLAFRPRHPAPVGVGGLLPARRLSESDTRQAIPRSESMPSK